MQIKSLTVFLEELFPQAGQGRKIPPASCAGRVTLTSFFFSFGLRFGHFILGCCRFAPSFNRSADDGRFFRLFLFSGGRQLAFGRQFQCVGFGAGRFATPARSARNFFRRFFLFDRLVRFPSRLCPFVGTRFRCVGLWCWPGSTSSSWRFYFFFLIFSRLFFLNNRNSFSDGSDYIRFFLCRSFNNWLLNLIQWRIKFLL